ncbi:MAG: hypothetical protein U5L04_03695 [Trueperaceae bacterium]|nr:hypothetical protein [Trueperaceae bacterium]
MTNNNFPPGNASDRKRSAANETDTTEQAGTTEKPTVPSPRYIELLYFGGCPSYKTVWNDLLDLSTAHDLDVLVRPIRVDSAKQADALRFAGSPSVKVDGVDLEDYRGAGVMACRIYEENAGRGWPSKTLLRERLLTKGHRDD